MAFSYAEQDWNQVMGKDAILILKEKLSLSMYILRHMCRKLW